MTHKDLDKLEALAKAATPGPWDCVQGIISGYWSVEDEDDSVFLADGYCEENDARYIAAANPSAVLELIARIRELESEAGGTTDAD